MQERISPVLHHYVVCVHPSDCTGTWGVCVAPYMLMDDAAVTHIPSGPPHTLLSAKKPSIWWSVG